MLGLDVDTLNICFNVLLLHCWFIDYILALYRSKVTESHRWFSIRLSLIPPLYLIPFSKYSMCYFSDLNLRQFKVIQCRVRSPNEKLISCMPSTVSNIHIQDTCCENLVTLDIGRFRSFKVMVPIDSQWVVSYPTSNYHRMLLSTEITC